MRCMPHLDLLLAGCAACLYISLRWQARVAAFARLLRGAMYALVRRRTLHTAQAMRGADA
jgi:hypothetical protein